MYDIPLNNIKTKKSYLITKCKSLNVSQISQINQYFENPNIYFDTKNIIIGTNIHSYSFC